LPGRIVHLPGRGEIFVRHHIHRNPEAPTLLLLHGWTASSDLQFFTAYEELAQHYSVIGVDHRGHGRGLRPNRPFALEDCADDAADVVRALGIGSVTLVGYSMGGPISLLLWKRHPELVDAMVLQATALEWNGTRSERNRWRVGHALGPVIRRVSTPRMIRFGLRKAIPRGHELSRFIPWIVGEVRRNDQWMVCQPLLFSPRMIDWCFRTSKRRWQTPFAQRLLSYMATIWHPCRCHENFLQLRVALLSWCRVV
jgi:pimeloyl-ACP methyl ester carboxylesterase